MTDKRPGSEDDDLAIRFTERDAVWRAYAGDSRGEPHFVPAGTPIPPKGTMLIDGRPTIRLAPDYSVEIPLWPQAAGGAVERLIPPVLWQRLIGWQALFDDNYDHESGWRSDSAKERWTADAHEIERQLLEALNGKIDLVVDLWPLGSDPSD